MNRVEFHDGRVIAFNGDCLEVVRGLADNSVDSVVTDPPYALVSIMKRFGKTALGDGTDTSDRSRHAHLRYTPAGAPLMKCTPPTRLANGVWG